MAVKRVVGFGWLKRFFLFFHILTLTFFLEHICIYAYNATGDKNVQMKLAQCWFPGLAICNAKLTINF